MRKKVRVCLCVFAYESIQHRICLYYCFLIPLFFFLLFLFLPLLSTRLLHGRWFTRLDFIMSTLFLCLTVFEPPAVVEWPPAACLSVQAILLVRGLLKVKRKTETHTHTLTHTYFLYFLPMFNKHTHTHTRTHTHTHSLSLSFYSVFFVPRSCSWYVFVFPSFIRTQP